MNVIFLTLVRITSVEERGLYHDLMRKFRDEGHRVYIVIPCERRLGLETNLVERDGVHILNVKTLNIQKTNMIEKGLGTLLMERQYRAAIKQYLGDVRFDLITYSTPPHNIHECREVFAAEESGRSDLSPTKRYLTAERG